MKINLTAIIKSKPESREEVKVLLLNMVENSKKEKACLQYDLHQNQEDDAVFIFHEIWENEAGLELHNTQPYIQKFIRESGNLISEPILIYKTDKIG